MFLAILAFVFMPIHIAAEIPSYIHVCGRKDPNLDQCIANSVNNLKDKLCDGMPELDVLPSELFTIDKLVVSDAPNTKIYITNAKITGFCDFVINSLRTDLDRLHFDFDILFKRIQINTTCDANVRVLVPIAYKGLIYITTDNVEVKINMDLKLVTKGSERYAYISMLKVNLDLKGYIAEFDVNETELGQFLEIIRNFINNNQEEFIKTLKPALEEVISKQVLLLSNNVVTHFTYEELFPDRI